MYQRALKLKQKTRNRVNLNAIKLTIIAIMT